MLQSFGAWLENTSIAQFISASTWAFPTIETIHVLFLTIVVGTIAVVDLRLIGAASTSRRVTDLSEQILPMTWVAFAGALITGTLLFSSKATEYLGNWPFRLKMGLMLAAGLNMLVFHFLTWRSVKAWDGERIPPPSARVAGFMSLGFWVFIVMFGRWIGFTVR